MNAKEISQKVESGDLYGLMLGVVRMWLDKDHPEADYATVVVEMGADLPSVQVPIIPSTSA